MVTMTFLKRMARAMMTGLGSLSPNCREASRLQSDGMDRALPALEVIGLRIHLLLCGWCRRYGKQIRFLRRAAHEHPEEVAQAASESLSPEARERIRRSLGNGTK